MDDERELWMIDNATHEVTGRRMIGPSVLENVHPASLCAGQNCCLHNPSDHALAGNALNWRGDRRIMERICDHGIGHPDPDDAAYRASIGDNDTEHSCDGCC